MKTGQIILIAVVFLVIGMLASSWYIKTRNVCYNLPTEGGPAQWGRHYWFAIHDIADRIPCSICRDEAREIFSAVHDYVNEKTSKSIYDEANYVKWLNKFCEIKSKRDTIHA